MILSNCHFITHIFHCDAWWNLWSSGPGRTGYLTVQKNGTARSRCRRRWCGIRALIERNTIALELQMSAAGVNVICLTYAWDWRNAIGPVIHGESKSQATGTVWVFLTEQSTLSQKLRVRLVLAVLVKLNIWGNSSRGFQKSYKRGMSCFKE